MPKSDIDFFTAGDIVQDIDRINKILATKVFEVTGHPLLKSAFTELMICLRDLLAKAEKYGSRISFTDDIIITNEVKDITDLVKFIRDALCHVSIYEHFVIQGQLKASFCVLRGKVTHAPFEPDHDVKLISDYSDDICFFFGLQKIYLKRHIIRAYREAKRELIPFPSFPDDVFTINKLPD